MEPPSYSRHLLTQFPAHKLVLGASSLLFKSLLDNTDTISIDQTVVCPEEFAILLEMVYTGEVPPGHHNFTKVISVADNLQMFDVAVSCKSLMANLNQGRRTGDHWTSHCSQCNTGAYSTLHHTQLFFLSGLIKEVSGNVENNVMDQEEINKRDCEQPGDKGPPEPGGIAAENGKRKVKGKPEFKQKFTCATCDKIFVFQCRLELHETYCRRGRQQKLIAFEECGEAQASQKDQEKHAIEANDSPKGKKRHFPVTCDICGKSFVHQSGLYYHMRSDHFEEKPFLCQDCGATFAAKSTLTNHMRLHTGEKLYVCKHCDLIFAQSIELTRHIRTHTGDKPYVCRECGKGFSQASGLSIHLDAFHSEWHQILPNPFQLHVGYSYKSIIINILNAFINVNYHGTRPIFIFTLPKTDDTYRCEMQHELPVSGGAQDAHPGGASL
uniref:Uncharacterized protein n=1 Tax=Callorhinchus milii TaxID=7868 RepID=A0A4W3HL10_CALMI